MRRIGEAKLPDTKYRLRPGAYGILVRDGLVLLTEEQGSDENLQLPGGGIDPGETPVRALHREVMEETGWRICGARRFGAFRRFVFMPELDLWAEKVCHIYLGRPSRRLGPPTEAGHVVHWLAPEKAIEMLGTEGNRTLFVQAVQRGLTG